MLPTRENDDPYKMHFNTQMSVLLFGPVGNLQSNALDLTEMSSKLAFSYKIPFF